ncbi:MAG TPA: DUF1540 domain-containing protein [Bdellovibrionales bacterium]|nr:DUF1540 domain-containing protein [Bdellovibrionales bacterium]
MNQPKVDRCNARSCAFNGSNQCRALAITVGEGIMTKCDTFMPSLMHIDEKSRVGCVGACKVTSCALNKNFECTAKQVRIGQINGQPGCLDFVSRTA